MAYLNGGYRYVKRLNLIVFVKRFCNLYLFLGGCKEIWSSIEMRKKLWFHKTLILMHNNYYKI